MLETTQHVAAARLRLEGRSPQALAAFMVADDPGATVESLRERIAALEECAER